MAKAGNMATATWTKEQTDALADALSLVSLFSNCIESINLIHPAHEGQHAEELLLSRLGIQQARLLIWGSTLGITSPPAITGIKQAVPLHPGNWNPEPDKPINFDARDPRLDEPVTRKIITIALTAIVEPIREFSRSQMLQVYGLVPYLGTTKPNTEQPALDSFRLEAFREKHALLRDVSLKFPHIPKRKHDPPKQAWAIQDQTKFEALLQLIRENIDYLIQLMNIQSRVDKSMKLDIRAMGWHPSDDIMRISRDTWKLSLLREACESEYPEYSDAAQEALDNIMDQWKGTQGYVARPDHLNPLIERTVLHSPSREVSPERYADKTKKQGGLLGLRPKFLRMFSGKTSEKVQSMPTSPVRPDGPARANSEWDSPKASLDPPRSNSIHGDNDLERTQTYESLTRMPTLTSQISRHDQYQGLERVPTKQREKIWKR